jgi:hypothetical protein
MFGGVGALFVLARAAVLQRRSTGRTASLLRNLELESL